MYQQSVLKTNFNFPRNIYKTGQWRKGDFTLSQKLLFELK